MAVLAEQAAPELEEDPRAARFSEVERGFFVGLEVGYLGLFKTPVAVPSRYPFAGSGGGQSHGFKTGLQIGYELNSRFAVSLFIFGASESASASYGAFDLMSAGADGRFSLVSWKDTNEVTRLHLYGHARLGYLRSNPEGLFGVYAESGLFRRSDLMLGAGPGLEYFTRLRHFSVGIALDFVYVLHAQAAGISAAPTLRYTF